MVDQLTRNVKVPLKDGTFLYIETAEPRGEQKVANAKIDIATLEGVLDAIEGFANKLKAVLDQVKPDSASIEFGVEVGLESGQLTAIIVKGTGKANLKITLGWGK